jgi:protein phosphatase
LLTIGAFARAAGLSPKALRLYDELGLLRPAQVDPVSGYRFYEPAQLDRARLVAWLRRLGMPLARIALVCDLPAAAAADAVAAYWAQVEADTASRRDLATFLTRYLSGRQAAIPAAHQTLCIRYAARSDIGQRRPTNQDRAYASAHLLAVADGTGNGGDRASAAAIDALKPLEALMSLKPLVPLEAPASFSTLPPLNTHTSSGTLQPPGALDAAEAGIPAGDLLNALSDAVRQASSALHDITGADPSLEGTGTTLTALLWSGSQLALVHIGDTRAYLCRDGEFFQITHDHTVVQSLLDEGRITPAEAASHPQRALLLRALDGSGTETPDLSFTDARAADRYLLCSDGLTAVASAEAIRGVLTTAEDPEQAVEQLIQLANQGGGPDNIACAVADIANPPAPPAG